MIKLINKKLFSFILSVVICFCYLNLNIENSKYSKVYALTSEQQSFINNIGKAAQKGFNTYKILPSMTTAQAILESNWGNSSLSKLYYNFFGMKAGNNYKGETVTLKTGEEINGIKITVNGTFRAYHSFDEGIEGYYQFITSMSRYSNLIGETDYKTACKKIKDDGWATDSSYTTKLINLIEKYNLTQFDTAISDIDPAWNPYLPIKAFSVKTGVTYVYKSDFKTKDGGEIWGNVESNNKIIDDECTIKKVFKNGWVEVEYPKSSGGTQIAYTPLSTFALGSDVSSKLSLDIGITTYKRADRSETAGYFDPETDKCIYIGTSGNSTQVLYTSTNGYYRLAFIDTECKLGTANKAWNSYLPIKAYSVKTGRTSLYNIDLKTKDGGEIWGNVENNKEIIDDECIIHKVYESGWVKVEYPKTVGGTQIAYTPLSTFALGSDVSSKLNFDIGITTYKRADRSEKIGYFDPETDKCVYIGSSGSSTQILYTSTNGYYRLAFIDTECKLGEVDKAWNSYLPIKSYSIKTGKIPLYNIDLKTKSGGEIWGNVENNKEIIDDECIIHKVYKNGWVKVEYPKTTGGTKTEYIKLSTFALGSDVSKKLKFDHKITTYKRADRSKSAGMFDPETDKCVLIGYSENSAQILYTSLNGYFRLAFIDKNEVIPQTTPATTTTKITTTTKVTTTTTTATKTTKATTTTAKTTKATTTTTINPVTTTTQTEITIQKPVKTNVDLNGDGEINTADIVFFQSIALKKYNDIEYIVDLNGDGIMNVFDMIILKRAVLAKS